ncbi:MAG TPA: response regulator [Thermoanaerobaculia bacterium]|nr:response regulator [Thermoanaerobaculia bacterium]HUM30768.1 response regulator [Thermoanaerobaculia bacterium]HXK69032.1 response regulator [Thermoanaerobaculia bacterium]
MSHRILVVDDEVAFLLGIRKVLSRLECDVDTAESIEQAEKILKEDKFDVVITDLRLTGVLGEEGLEIIRYVRELNPETRCILVTGYGSPAIREKAYTEGVDYYFEKPVPPKTIVESLVALGVQERQAKA